MKNKISIILLSMGVLLIAFTLVMTISAWLTDQDEIQFTDFKVGKIEYTLTGAIKNSTTPFVPGENLIGESTPIVITNKSTVDSQLRVFVTVTVRSSLTEGAQVTTVDFTDIFTIPNTESTILATGWVWNETAKMWYYKGSSEGNNFEDWVISKVAEGSSQDISVCTSLSMDGWKVGNQYAGKYFTVKFTFQAKQKDYVTWNDLGSANFSFSTGLITSN